MTFGKMSINSYLWDRYGSARLLKRLESTPKDGKYTIIIRSTAKHRSIISNNLQQQWHKEAGDQEENMTAEEHRGYCKLHFGVPILCRDSEEYNAKYREIIRPLPYEMKLLLMQIPLDYPVTRGMSNKQHSEYMDLVHRHYSELGIILTEPR